MALNSFPFSKRKTMNAIKVEGIHFEHKCLMRCLTCFLGNWLSVPMKWMTIINLLDDTSLGVTAVAWPSLVSQWYTQLCSLSHFFLIILEVMLLWSFHVYSCNSTYGKLTQEINWVIFFLALYFPYGEGARADTSLMIAFQGLQLTKFFNSKMQNTVLLKYP